MAITDYIEDLIYRVLSRRATVEERREFERWLQASEDHRRFFREVERAWYTGRFAMKWRNVKMSEAWRSVEHRHGRRRARRVLQLWGSVAAVVAVIMGMLWYLEPWKDEMPPVPMAEQVIPPGESKAILVLPNRQQVNLSGVGQDTIRDGEMSIFNRNKRVDYHQATKESDVVVYHELVIPRGGEYQLCLSDSTIVYLNSGSRLRFPVHFSGDKREVLLEGEAYFDVQRDEERPFVVHADEVAVTVLGTGFNVMAYKEETRLEVTLVEGAVKVGDGKKSLELLPDQQFVLDRATGKEQVRTVDASAFAEWRMGVLNFDGMPLDELSDRLSRWYNVDFFFSGENLKKLRFTGAVRKYRDIAYNLRLIEATTDVKFSIQGQTIIVNQK